MISSLTEGGVDRERREFLNKGVNRCALEEDGAFPEEEGVFGKEVGKVIFAVLEKS